ncbi:MAG: peptidylprolyl isomerase [Planctomycetota bacterium]|nr:peptidylprolyl isomerase [Planctomycetota bacterium]
MTEGSVTEGAMTEGGTAQPATTAVRPGGTGDPANAVSTAPGTPNPALAEKPPTGPDSVVEVKPVTPPETPTPAASSPALLDPALATEKAPDAYRVKLETSKGDIVIQVTRASAPHGADRFYNLVKIGFYDGVRFFRVFPDELAQFGISGNPAVSEKWKRAKFPDDPPVKSNVRGSISMAKVIDSENSATTQVFINIGDNPEYDKDGFTPFGMISEGLDVVGRLTSEYGDKGPSSTHILEKGNSFLLANFPKLDFIKKATIVE